MLYVFGKGNANPNNIVTKFGITKLMYGQEMRNAKQVAPHVATAYNQTVELLGIIEALIPSGGSGVVANSFGKEFAMKASDVYNSNGTLYARMSPGIAVNNGNVYVSKPCPGIAARTLEKVMKLNTEGNEESVDIQYDFETDTFKSKIKKKASGADKYDSAEEYFFPNEDVWNDSSKPGISSGVKLIDSILKNPKIGQFLRQAIGNDLTKVPLEFTKTVSSGTHYFILSSSGFITTTTTPPSEEGSDVQLAQFTAGFNGASGIDTSHSKIFGGGGWIVSDGMDDYSIEPGGKIIFTNATSISADSDGTVTIILPTGS